MVRLKTPQKLYSILNLAPGIGVLNLGEFQICKPDFVLGFLDGILFALDPLQKLLFGVAPKCRRGGQSSAKATQTARIVQRPRAILSDYSYFESSRRRSFARWVACHS